MLRRKRQPVRHEPVAQREREHIHIAVPTLGNTVHNAVHAFLTTITIANADQRCPWVFTWEILNDKRPVHYARNLLCRTVLLDPSITRLWFIDADMVPPENALRLLEVDADIVMGQAYTFDHRSKQLSRPASLKLCAYRYGEHTNSFYPLVPHGQNAVVPVSGAGTACMVIRRSVLEDPRLHLDPSYVHNDGTVHHMYDEDERSQWAPALFQTREMPNGEILRGEDLDFCRRASLLGYRLKCHLGVRFGHAKRIDLNEALDVMHRVAAGVAQDIKNEQMDEMTVPLYQSGGRRM